MSSTVILDLTFPHENLQNGVPDCGYILQSMHKLISSSSGNMLTSLYLAQVASSECNVCLL